MISTSSGVMMNWIGAAAFIMIRIAPALRLETSIFAAERLPLLAFLIPGRTLAIETT